VGNVRCDHDPLIRSRSGACQRAFIKMNCRYCNKPLTDAGVVTRSYWSALEFRCHAECKVAGERQEAINCQTIDADCNDCRHYKRGRLAHHVISNVTTPDGRVVEIGHRPNIFVDGLCLKFNRPTVAQPNKWSGFECFEHRRL
jgi:hypothetical protein